MLADEVALSEEQAKACVALTTVSSAADGLAEQVRGLGVSHPLLDEGLDELLRVLDGTASLQSERLAVVADLSVARGLDYYTGTVFETRMAGFEHLGSICSGGRYDALASDGRTTYPGVGISFGVTRTIAPLLSRGLLTATRSTPTCVLVAVPDEDGRAPRAGDRGRRSARARRADRGLAVGAEVRQADPVRASVAASRSCGSRRTTAPTRCATSAPASRATPIRRRGSHRRRTCARA